MKAWMALIALLLALVLVWGGCRKNDESDAFEPSCSDPQWAPDSGYVIGSTVQNLGQRYECFGHAGWCNQAPYEPDGENPFWEETWTHLGACTGGPDPDPPGNRITLQLPTNIEFGTGEASGDITGKLQCGTDVHPVKGSWGQTVVIDDLKQCDYVLIMDSNAIGASMDTGRVIRVTQQGGQNIRRAETMYALELNLEKARATAILYFNSMDPADYGTVMRVDPATGKADVLARAGWRPRC